MYELTSTSENEPYQTELETLRKEIDSLRTKVAALDELELELGDKHVQLDAFDSRHNYYSSVSDEKLVQYAELKPYHKIRNYISGSTKEIYNLKEARDFWQGKAAKWYQRHKYWVANTTDVKQKKLCPPKQTDMPFGTVLETSKSPPSPTIEVFEDSKQGPLAQYSPHLSKYPLQNVPEMSWHIEQSIESGVSMKESAVCPNNEIHAHVHPPSGEGNQSTEDIAIGDPEEKSNAAETSNDFESGPEFLQGSLGSRPSLDKQQNQPVQPYDIKESDKSIVIFERILKRKRESVPHEPKASAKIKERPVVEGEESSVVKNELSSSNPVAPDLSHSLKAHDSVDLDEFTRNLRTPRRSSCKKRRIERRRRSLSPLVAPANSHLATEVCVYKQRNTSTNDCGSLDQSIKNGNIGAKIPEVHDDAYCQRQGEHFAERLRQKDKVQNRALLRSENSLCEDRQLAEYASVRSTSPAPQSHRQSEDCNMLEDTDFKKVLHPADPNKRILPRCRSPPGSREVWGQPSHKQQGHVHIQSIAEDGDNGPEAPGDVHQFAEKPPQNSNSNSYLATQENEKAHRVQSRLENLMSEPSPNNPPLDIGGFPVNPSRSARNSNPLAITDLPGDQLLKNTKPHQHMPMSSSVSKLKAAEPQHKIPSSMNAIYLSPFARPRNKSPPKNHSPLRSRLVSDLYLDDFKVNPKHNQGYEYPFKEVVRERDQRKHLPGCTNLECCGAIFRKMAGIGTVKTTNTGLLTSSPSRDDEESMLEDYLGDQRQRLRHISCEERAELLLQAKARILAEHYSRHRQAYAREPSPAGYWDVDMPNTQEVDELGKAAELRTRQKVEERYREAMQPDGLWKFKDE